MPSTLSFALGLLVAFFPKCPLCWAAYLGVLGLLGSSWLPYLDWMFPALAAMLGLHLTLLFRKAPGIGYGPFALSLAGALTLLAGRHYLPSVGWVLVTGPLLVATGSLWSNFSSCDQPPVQASSPPIPRTNTI